MNKVVEIAPDGKVVWEHTINGYPQDARRLENGNTLIALQTTNRVVEIDRSGKVTARLTGHRDNIALLKQIVAG